MVDRSAAIRGVAAAFLALSSVAVILRCYVRLRIVKAFGWDDFVMIISMLFYIMFCTCMIGGSLWGTGKHLTELTAEQRTMAMEYWWFCNISYAISSVLAKISVCIFLLRVMLFPGHRAVLYTVTTLAICTGIPFFVLLIIQCSPVSFWWTRMRGDTDGHCGYVNAIGIVLYIFSASSALFDLTVGTLPSLLVRKLQMNRRTKAAVAGLLGMACIACIAIIIRLAFVPTIHDPDFLCMRAVPPPSLLCADHTNHTTQLDGTVEIAIWSCVEIGLSITAGSLATTRPLFRILYNRSPPNYDPASDPSTSQYHRTKHRRSTSGSTLNPNRRSRRLSLFDSGLSFFSRTRSGSVSRTHTTSSTSRHSTSLDKSRSGPEGRPSLSFYEPYIGVQMLSMRPTADVEGGRVEFDGSTHPDPGSELLNLNSHVEFDLHAGGGRPEGLSVPEPAARKGSRIGVHRTFKVSSENERDRDKQNEGESDGKDDGEQGGPGYG
ncbi:hypothetical protein BDW74DRAFT_62543 [Aspergillus multicolor]|uniref:uncharacterized protein n=1 Tax=Aspergillus multicolor TaxID=41759 RepID=UPI003CCE14A2